MTARILVVDDHESNVKLLDAWLSHDYFQVVTALDGETAIRRAREESPDVILLDIMMPGMDGFEVCRRLKSDESTEHIPIILVTALDSAEDKVRGLEAGADDFLTKPVDQVALMARVRALARFKTVVDELRLRETTYADFGGGSPWQAAKAESLDNAKLLLLEDRGLDLGFLEESLGDNVTLTDTHTIGDAMKALTGTDFDLLIVDLAAKEFDGLRACAEMRSTEEGRFPPLLVLDDDNHPERLVRAFDLGASDYLVQPVDRNELIARSRTHIRRKRYSDRLRADLRQNVRLGAIDPLTGLYNRRYLERHLKTLIDKAREEEKPLSLMMIDIDHFKKINDSFGHENGDAVLAEFGERLLENVRGIDLTARYGGEEFVVVLPDTTLDQAEKAAERLASAIRRAPFTIEDGETALPVTASFGVALLGGDGDPVQALLRRADRALYAAKNAGRDRVAVEAA